MNEEATCSSSRACGSAPRCAATTTSLGENFHVQKGSVLHTDQGVPLTIRDNVTVGHMVLLHGCDIGDGSLIGIGSTILNGVKIGKNCLVGARTLIPAGKVIPDNGMVIGTPAEGTQHRTGSEEKK